MKVLMFYGLDIYEAYKLPRRCGKITKLVLQIINTDCDPYWLF